MLTWEQGYLALRGRGLLTVHDIQYTRDQHNTHTLTHSLTHTLISTSRGSSHLVLLVLLVLLAFLVPR